jgi:hypothetical protein
MEVIRDAGLEKLSRFLLKPIERCWESRPVQMLRRDITLIKQVGRRSRLPFVVIETHSVLLITSSKVLSRSFLVACARSFCLHVLLAGPILVRLELDL